jgi:hypothetical protein
VGGVAGIEANIPREQVALCTEMQLVREVERHGSPGREIILSRPGVAGKPAAASRRPARGRRRRLRRLGREEAGR